MDAIRQAIDMARSAGPSPTQGGPAGTRSSPVPHTTVTLDPVWLERRHIVGHGDVSVQSTAYDMLRTQVLHEMDRNDWQFLAITSPTAGCGKSVTACNLALSISRLPERSALLLDFDMHKPSIAKYLGIDADPGVLGVLEDRASLASAVVDAQFGRNTLSVLPGEVCKSGAPEWMASQAMATLLQTVKREFSSHIAIVDLPPMLASDEVISVLPRMDAVLLIVSADVTTPAEIQECRKFLQSTPVVRVVLNRVTDTAGSYYGYGYGKSAR
jgi:Mrp family chromosome partitioning ATPase